jgi:hypothetical protein
VRDKEGAPGEYEVEEVDVDAAIQQHRVLMELRERHYFKHLLKRHPGHPLVLSHPDHPNKKAKLTEKVQESTQKEGCVCP